MTYFLRQPNGIFLRSNEQLLSVGEQLNVGTYTVGITPQGEYFLTVADSFDRPGKLYGNTTAKAKKILNTFLDRKNSTGVLLSGQHGSGKTMLARELCILAAEANIATILVGNAFCGPAFNAFIQSIDMPAVIMFDEFEKVYDGESQQELLTLLDGVYPTKKLFVLTANNTYHIDDHMFNRPGRIFYHLKYSGLELEFVKEYTYDTLKNQDHAESIFNTYSIFHAFTFDMLKALIEEMNRYDSNAMEALEMLNISPVHDYANNEKFDVTILFKGKVVKNNNDGYYGNPFDSNDLTFSYVHPKNQSYEVVKMTMNNFAGAKDGKYTFINGDITVILTKEKIKGFDYRLVA